jgi:hypothetical protein
MEEVTGSGQTDGGDLPASGTPEATGTEPGPNDSQAPGQADENTTQPQDQSGEGEPKLEVVKDGEGKEWIPKAAFQGRVDALTARNKALEEKADVLNRLDSDPEFREQFIAKLQEGLKEKAGSEDPEAEQRPSPFFEWLEKTVGQSPEHKAFYTDYAQAIAGEFQMELQRRDEIIEGLKRDVAAVKRYVGDTEVKSFSQQFSDFPKYQPAVTKLMKEHPTLTLKEAYVLASHEDRLKQMNSGKNAQNRTKLGNTPVAGKGASSTGSARHEPQSLSDAIKESMREHGMKI